MDVQSHPDILIGDDSIHRKYCPNPDKYVLTADKIHVSPTALSVMVSPWSFSMWGMDVIGPISPKASNGHRFIFVVIDYFTKWVEAASYVSVMKLVVVQFIKKEIICQFSKRIISDNGLNLNNDMVIGCAPDSR